MNLGGLSYSAGFTDREGLCDVGFSLSARVSAEIERVGFGKTRPTVLRVNLGGLSHSAGFTDREGLCDVGFSLSARVSAEIERVGFGRNTTYRIASELGWAVSLRGLH